MPRAARDRRVASRILPDSSLFGDQAGEVFRHLANEARLHTVLRLPRGTFTPYCQGVKANVVFFTKGERTDAVWIHDSRTNVLPVTKKERPLSPEHFADFEKCYGPDPNGMAKRKKADSKEDRWRKFTLGEVEAEGFKLDGLRWLKEELNIDDEPGDPEDLVAEAQKDMKAASDGLERLLELLRQEAKL